MPLPSLKGQKCGDIVELYSEICIIERGNDFDVPVTSNLQCCYLFWYVWKEATYLYDRFVTRGKVTNNPLVRRATNKYLG